MRKVISGILLSFLISTVSAQNEDSKPKFPDFSKWKLAGEHDGLFTYDNRKVFLMHEHFSLDVGAEEAEHIILFYHPVVHLRFAIYLRGKNIEDQEPDIRRYLFEKKEDKDWEFITELASPAHFYEIVDSRYGLKPRPEEKSGEGPGKEKKEDNGNKN
ncbi:MAG: hypothetical protein HY506_02440 [Candidatus Yanofskybacteria bacterium]|nr:hypothetical protein [Candidatus Yanofskybacteria bacterium]